MLSLDSWQTPYCIETGKPSPCTGPFILARMLRLQRFQNKYKAIDSSSTAKAIYKTISSYRYNQSSQASDNNSSHKPGDTTQRARTWSHNIQKGGLSPRGLRSDENKRSMQTCHTYLEKWRGHNLRLGDDDDEELAKPRSTSCEQLPGQTHHTPPSISTSGTSMPHHNRIQKCFSFQPYYYDLKK